MLCYRNVVGSSGELGKVLPSVLLALQVTANISSELHGLKVRTLSIGGMLGDEKEVQQGFRGCMQVKCW